MSARNSQGPRPRSIDLAEINGPDEADEALAVLRSLLGRVGSPVVRACLEEAAADIAHLTGREERGRDEAKAA
jgi:hypothetical protein